MAQLLDPSQNYEIYAEMLARELLTLTVDPIGRLESAGIAIQRMNDLGIRHLPVMRGEEYAGLITLDQLRALPGNEPVLPDPASLLPWSVYDHQHVYEVVDLVVGHDLSLLPVINAGRNLEGVITLPGLVRAIGRLTASSGTGAILALRLARVDYSPTILCRIIEENQAIVLSLYMTPDETGPDVTVTVRVNTSETASMIRSFDRYGYTVQSHYLDSSQLDDFYRSRYEEFMNYMNI